MIKFEAGQKVEARIDGVWVDAVVRWRIEKGDVVCYDVEFTKTDESIDVYEGEGAIVYQGGPANEIR